MDLKVLVFGDSIVFGSWDKEFGGWVNRFRLALEAAVDSDARYARFRRAHTFNMGISGQTVGQVLDRLDNEAACRNVIDDEYRLIILSAGVNDCLRDAGVIATEEDEFRSTVRELIRRAKANADKVLYLGLTRTDEDRTSSWPRVPSWAWLNADIERYDRIIEEICLEEDCDYLPTAELLDVKAHYDGLHPGAAGHAVLADAVKKEIERLI